MTQLNTNQLPHLNQSHLQVSRIDNTLPQNEQLINNLNKKIDRRINNGYYFQVAAQRKSLMYSPNFEKRPQKKKPKQIHPIIKKLKKITEQKINFVDQQQNTDEAQFCEQYQNTSGMYVLQESEVILEDEEMQFSCQVTQIQQKNQSIQWNIEPIQQFNEQVQYTLQNELIFIQCRDASIQYTLESQHEIIPQAQLKLQSEQEPILPSPQKIDTSVQYEKQKLQETSVQCEQIKKFQYSIQYSQPLPQKQQKKIQIQIPDIRQLQKIESIESKLKYLKLQQRKQKKLQRKKDKQIQILKLKEIMQKLEGKIELAQEKEVNMKKKFESKLQFLQKSKQIQKNRELFFQRDRQNLKKQIKKETQREYNKKLQILVSKFYQGNKRSIINNSFRQQEQKRLSEIKKQEKLSKQELQNYKKQVSQLKAQIKNQMFKRLQYENQSEDETASEQNLRSFSQSKIIKFGLQKQSFDASMGNLFPNSKNRYAGSIIKNIPVNISYEQRKLNDHQEMQRSVRAYWKSKSAFDYQYENLKTPRIIRKYDYLQKLSHQKLKQIEKVFDLPNPQKKISNYSPIKRRLKFGSRIINQSSAKLKYTSKILSKSWNQMLEIRKNIDQLYKNEQLFFYLYSQNDKIKLGLKLFEILQVKIDQKLQNPITILKYKNYIVFQHKLIKGFQFILFYHHNRSIIHGKNLNQTITLQYFQNSINYKNGQIFQYIHQTELFNGVYINGQRQGFGILSNSTIHYQGLFSNNKKNGEGKIILENGDIYIGEFENDFFHGEGNYTWTNGQVYDGFFKAGFKHGYGRHFFKSGDYYEGTYELNKRQGNGVYRWKNGSVYDGEFKADQKCGQGKFIDFSGNILIGQWKFDQYVQKNYQKLQKKILHGDLPLDTKQKAKNILRNC